MRGSGGAVRPWLRACAQGTPRVQHRGGGNPLAAAIAVASLDVIVKEKLIERSFELGEYFMNKLQTISNPHVKQIRGKGLLIGLVLDTKARPYCEDLAKRGVLCKETHENVIRFAPPLVISKKEIDWVCARIAESLKKINP